MTTIRFESRLLREKGVYAVELPKSARLSATSKTIEGTINNFPFRTTIEKKGNGHTLRINEAIRKAAQADVGDVVTVEITRIGEEPETRVPADLKKALAVAPSAQIAWEKITPMARRDWILSISTVKQPETRKRRIEKTCDMLAKGKGRVCCFPGINWMTKDHVSKEETWQPLPRLRPSKK